MKKGEEPAFSAKYKSLNGMQSGPEGISVRDYFAAMALQGALAGLLVDATEELDPTRVSKRCYALADAMIRERE